MNNASPLKGKYLIKNIYLLSFVKIIDSCTFFLTYFHRKKKINNPNKILISNIAHLGDLLLSTSVLTLIKKKFPNCKIGFICSSASKELIENHPLIDKIFTLDHWKLNRSKSSFFKKFTKYLKTRSKALKEIKNEKYDIAIDLYFYFPNSIYLFWKANIPIRIGYTSAGFGNFLTHKIDWQNQNKHITLYHVDLLKFLKVDLIEKEKKYLDLDLSLFLSKNIKIDLPNNYIIFHIGAGDNKKKWELNKWKTLSDWFLKKGKTIIFTGRGDEEENEIQEIIKDKQNCISLCNKLSLVETMYVIRNSKLVICVDSLILHISTALNKPTITIYCGINNHHHWVMKKDNVFPIIKSLECTPCFNKNGCDSMDCLNKIDVNEITKLSETIVEEFN